MRNSLREVSIRAFAKLLLREPGVPGPESAYRWAEDLLEKLADQEVVLRSGFDRDGYKAADDDVVRHLILAWGLGKPSLREHVSRWSIAVSPAEALQGTDLGFTTERLARPLPPPTRPLWEKPAWDVFCRLVNMVQHRHPESGRICLLPGPALVHAHRATSAAEPDLIVVSARRMVEASTRAFAHAVERDWAPGNNVRDHLGTLAMIDVDEPLVDALEAVYGELSRGVHGGNVSLSAAKAMFGRALLSIDAVSRWFSPEPLPAS